MPHFEVSSFLAAAIGLLGFVSLCLLVFGRLGIGSIVAFLVAGLLVGIIRDLPDESVLALREFAELGVILSERGAPAGPAGLHASHVARMRGEREGHARRGILEIGFGRQIAGVMLAIGHVMKEAVRPDELFEDSEAFRLTVESVNLLLELIDPGGNPAAWARLQKAFYDDTHPVHYPEIFASAVAGAIVDPEQEEDAGFGPLIPLIRNWFGAVLIERLRQRLGLPPPSQQ